MTTSARCGRGSDVTDDQKRRYHDNFGEPTITDAILDTWSQAQERCPGGTALAPWDPELGLALDWGLTAITFGDPDFFNGPRHALAIAGALARLRQNHLLAADADLEALTTTTLAASTRVAAAVMMRSMPIF